VQFRSNDGNRQAVTVSPLRYAPVQREKKLSAQRLAMFRPSEPTEWESIACEFIANACKTLGLYAVIVDVPPLAEYSAEFFHRSMGEGAARAILFERSAYARLFVCQANQYRDVARMIIGETLALPGALAGAEGLPSLADSIMSFLTSDGTVQLTTGPNTGWDRMWAALDRASSVT
jgi:hypothetical protein